MIVVIQTKVLERNHFYSKLPLKTFSLVLAQRNKQYIIANVIVKLKAISYMFFVLTTSLCLLFECGPSNIRFNADIAFAAMQVKRMLGRRCLSNAQ